jgi:molybdopterin-containing oxidoreductase family iron-sulfur binding subunit
VSLLAMETDHETELWHGIGERLAGERGPRLWRSLEEFAESDELRDFVAAEFPDLARPDLVDRRTLLRIMAASLALAGCKPSYPPLPSPPQGVPGHTPGRSITFATTLELGGYGRGVLVETYEGRPIRIDGNPLHPASLGSLDVFGQAEILSLYDPDRSRMPRDQGVERGWDTATTVLSTIRAELGARHGRGLRVLSEPLASPTTLMLAEELRAAYPDAVWHEYSPLADDNARQGAIMAFGEPVETVPDLRQADVVLSLGCDLFGDAPGHLRHAADFAAHKRGAPEAGRRPYLCVAESSPTITGASASQHIVLHPREFEPLARSILALLKGEPIAEAHPAADPISARLRRAGPRGLVTVGRDQPPMVHVLAHAINTALGAVGQSLRYIAPVHGGDQGSVRSLAALTQAMAAGSVSHLLILGGNPIYDAPADIGFKEALKRVPFSLHLGTHVDETALACRWHLPRRHALESWGDARAFDGTVGLRQPATVPLIDALTPDELLGALLTGTIPKIGEPVQSYWRKQWRDRFNALWPRALETGIVPDSAAPLLNPALRDDWDRASPPVQDTRGVTVTFTTDPSVWDGRFANNGWLQELPRPLTKIVWGNAALIAPVTAEAFGLKAGDVVELSIDGGKLQVPVWPMPNQAPGVVTLPLGYGRWAAGRVGSLIGFDAYKLRLSQHPWILDNVQLVKTAATQPLISTQNHHWIESNDIIRVVDEGQLKAAPVPAEQPSLYPEHVYPTYAWAMAIDLDACIGCNACVIACQSENNIPVVGPEEAARGRVMHWLRVDRYHDGDPGHAQTYFQPVPCMHCEKAPCEVVCPVNATVHSSEGLNDMVYNRCVGTRTCSNNCPYKVRRFNWFDYDKRDPLSTGTRANPHVTVRQRGVMEKCTYCVQRISAARIDARMEDRTVRDGEIKTACQSACPTQAIVFGDANDPTSLVSRLKSSPRNYALLGDLNTQPRTTYLARVADTRGEPETGGEVWSRRIRLRPRPLPILPSRRGSAGAGPFRFWHPACSWPCSPMPYHAAPVRHRAVGHQHPLCLGIRPHQLCLVDRHRQRGEPRGQHPRAAPARPANRRQSLCGSRQPDRGHLRRHLPDLSPRKTLAVLLGVSTALHVRCLAAVPQLAHLGFLGDQHARDHDDPALVHRPDSGSGDPA